jgi:hypothetical protein
MLRQKEEQDMTPRVLAVEIYPLDPFRFDPPSLRLHNTKQARQVTQNFQGFGFNFSDLIDGRLIAGNGRRLVAEVIGHFCDVIELDPYYGDKSRRKISRAFEAAFAQREKERPDAQQG